jgi:hypothetical protein
MVGANSLHASYIQFGISMRDYKRLKIRVFLIPGLLIHNSQSLTPSV